MKEIEEKILDKERHKTYGFDAAKFKELTEHRPLEITTPISIPYLEMDATSIFEEINRISDSILYDGFTLDDENWWQGKEADNLKTKVVWVQKAKKARVDECAYDSKSRACMGEGAWN